MLWPTYSALFSDTSYQAQSVSHARNRVTIESRLDDHVPFFDSLKVRSSEVDPSVKTVFLENKI
jgi:hypothetical protein